MEQNMVPRRKRQYFTHAQKERIVQELKIRNVSLSQLARHYGLSPVTIYKWRKDMRRTEDDNVIDIAEVHQLRDVVVQSNRTPSLRN